MKKYKILFTFIVVVVYLINLYVDYASLNKERKAYLKDLSMDTVDINQTVKIDLDTITSSTYKDWGLKKSFLLQKREDEKKLLADMISSSSKKLDKNFEITNRIVCLEKKCWEFMGIVKINDQVRVTLLSKDKKPKLETFQIGSILLENLKIIDIQSNKMIIFDSKKEEKFDLKLFDVNVKKYYPKNKIKQKGIK